jgi:hypothetical protein
MIAVDTHILFDTHREDSPWYEKALDQDTMFANSGAPWAIAWSSLHEFLAIVTPENPRCPHRFDLPAPRRQKTLVRPPRLQFLSGLGL